MNWIKKLNNNKENKKNTKDYEIKQNEREDNSETEIIKYQSSIELVILELLINKDKQCAGELERNIKNKPAYKNRTIINFVASSIYRKVKDLENKAYIKGEIKKITPKKEIREYSITPKGRDYLNRLLIEKTKDSLGKYLINFNYTIGLMDYIDNKERLKYLDNIKSIIVREKERNEQESYNDGYTNRIMYNQKMYILDGLLQWITEIEFDLKIEER